MAHQAPPSMGFSRQECWRSKDLSGPISPHIIWPLILSPVHCLSHFPVTPGFHPTGFLVALQTPRSVAFIIAASFSWNTFILHREPGADLASSLYSLYHSQVSSSDRTSLPTPMLLSFPAYFFSIAVITIICFL